MSVAGFEFPTSGSIVVDGVGGISSGTAHGVFVSDSGTILKSSTGGIILNGIGGNSVTVRSVRGGAAGSSGRTIAARKAACSSARIATSVKLSRVRWVTSGCAHKSRSCARLRTRPP